MKAIDSITLEIIWTRLTSIVDEVASTVIRTSFSSVVREAEDFSVAMLDSRGNLLVQGTYSIPSHLGAMPNVIKHFLKKFPIAEIEPGDVFITNDPWIGNGHLEDVFVVTPIFYHVKIVAFSVCIIHHIDIGGRIGTPESREIYEEGLRIPMSRLYKAGFPNEDIFNIIEANVRVSDKVIGDIMAQVTGNQLGSIRLCGMLSELKWESLEEFADEIFRITEEGMRASIEKIPDGVYGYEYPMEETGTSGSPISVRASVEIKGSSITVDYAGTSAQEDRAINVCFNYTYAHTIFGIKAAINPLIPNNAGCLRPIIVRAPEGCILNAKFPAALSSRTLIGHLLPEVMFFALSSVIPGNIIAGSGSTPTGSLIFAGEKEDGTKFILWNFPQGGMGASAHKDGVSCLSFPANLSITSIEIIENEAPLLFEKKALIQDSGGPGRFRGGLGQEIHIRVLEKGIAKTKRILANLRGGRFKYPARGLFGGKDGSKAEISAGGESLNRTTQVILKKDDIVIYKLPGGGGYGNPLDRDPISLKDDVQNGLVSLKNAFYEYGVIISPETMEVDIEQTKKLRAELSLGNSLV